MLAPIIANRPTANFFQSSVRHLFVDCFANRNKPADVEAILTACNWLTDLVAWFEPAKYVRALGALQCLRRVTIDFEALSAPFLINDALPLFRNVTHLELFDLSGNIESISGGRELCARLRLIPHLTHVAFVSTPRGTIFSILLRADTRLRCIVFRTFCPDWLEGAGSIVDDDRLVCFWQETDEREEWLRGACTAYDYWALADAFIAARRAGTVEREHSWSHLKSLTEVNPISRIVTPYI